VGEPHRGHREHEGAGTSQRTGNGDTSESNFIADQTTARIVQQAVITAPNDAAKAAAARAAVAKVEAEQAATENAAKAAAAKKAAVEQAEKEAAAKAKLKPTDGRSLPGPSPSVIAQAAGGPIGGVGVDSTAAGAEDGAILFRGAAEGYAGSPGTQGSGITPASTDPKVPTAFATRAEQYGSALVHVATQGDLAGIKVELRAGYLAATPARTKKPSPARFVTL